MVHHFIYAHLINKRLQFLLKEKDYYKIIEYYDPLRYKDLDFKGKLRAVCFIKQHSTYSYFEIHKKVKCPYKYDNCFNHFKFYCKHWDMRQIECALKNLKKEKLNVFS